EGGRRLELRVGVHGRPQRRRPRRQRQQRVGLIDADPAGQHVVKAGAAAEPAQRHPHRVLVALYEGGEGFCFPRRKWFRMSSISRPGTLIGVPFTASLTRCASCGDKPSAAKISVSVSSASAATQPAHVGCGISMTAPPSSRSSSYGSFAACATSSESFVISEAHRRLV